MQRGTEASNAGLRPSRKPQVAVIYHFFPHYRKAVVEALARSEVANFTFIGDDHEYLHSIEPAKFSDSVRFRLAPTHHLFGPFMWQWGAITWAIKPEFDTVIMHSVPHWPCTWIGAMMARLLGKRVFFWGHGYLRQPRGLKGLLRRIFHALPHALLLYGRRAKDFAIRDGRAADTVHVIYNSLDLERQIEIRRSISPHQGIETRRSLFGCPDRPAVICTTRLIAIRRLDLLIKALAILRDRGLPTNLILVGDGPERENLRILAASTGVQVHFEGACYDESRIAQLICCASVAVAPGKVGLSAMHAMAYGVPVVSNDDADSQMPEWESIIPGKTGSYFRAGDVESLADAILIWLTGERSAEAYAACTMLLKRFWNPTYQRRAIERAVAGIAANDLFDSQEPPTAVESAKLGE
jgi:glycosyltransferase involved in cell wall biosynthesis